MKNLFKPLGWFYYPTSIIGTIIYILCIIFLVTVFIAIDRNSHSVSDTFYGIFPYFACVFLLINWFASKSCD